jgi:hypothetical protein
VVEGILPDVEAEQVEQRVAARLTRQELLTSREPPQLWVVIDQGVLHRMVGGPSVMAAQLRHLARQSSHPGVTFQVIPWEAGPHPGMDGSFTMIRIAGPLPDVVYVESLLGAHYLQSPADLERYRRVFDHLRAVALSPRDSVAHVLEIAKEHDSHHHYAKPEST